MSVIAIIYAVLIALWVAGLFHASWVLVFFWPLIPVIVIFLLGLLGVGVGTGLMIFNGRKNRYR